MKNELLTCFVCHKQHKRSDTDQYVYHDSVGVVCLSHHGVEKWYKELNELATKKA